MVLDIKEQIAYHTCKADNGYHFIVKNIPFISGNGSNQWLTQGYYFWTDSDYWAKKWGKPENRAIGKFKINLCFSSEILDLVGNVEHQLEFQKFAELILQKTKEGDHLTVNQIVTWLRGKKEIFPYKGIKAEDQTRVVKYKFVSQRNETMSLVTRQQLCIFEEGREKVKLLGFIEPKSFTSHLPR